MGKLCNQCEQVKNNYKKKKKKTISDAWGFEPLTFKNFAFSSGCLLPSVKRKRRHRIHGKCGTAFERKKVKVITITITWNKNMTIEQYRPSEHIKRQSSHIETTLKKM